MGGDGGMMLVDPKNGCRAVGEYTNLTLQLTTNCGENDGSAPTIEQIAPGDPNAQFIAPFVADDNPAYADRYWVAGGRYVWDNTKTWKSTEDANGWNQAFDLTTGTGGNPAASATAVASQTHDDAAGKPVHVVYAGWCGSCSSTDVQQRCRHQRRRHVAPAADAVQARRQRRPHPDAEAVHLRRDDRPQGHLWQDGLRHVQRLQRPLHRGLRCGLRPRVQVDRRRRHLRRHQRRQRGDRLAARRPLERPGRRRSRQPLPGHRHRRLRQRGRARTVTGPGCRPACRPRSRPTCSCSPTARVPGCTTAPSGAVSGR